MQLQTSNMDDFGNQLHFTDIVRGFYSYGLYGYSPDYSGFMGLGEGIDWSDMPEETHLPRLFKRNQS